MNRETRHERIAGPAGEIECAVDEPAAGHPLLGVAVLCHPHPMFGGTMDNKVVQTIARAALGLGLRAVRFNFRGVGGSAGQYDEGRGEVDDALAVAAHYRNPDLPLSLAGFSFGGFVAARAAAALAAQARRADRLVLVAPATTRFDPGPVPDHTLVIHGEADDVVPLPATLDWARPQNLPVLVLPGVGHFFHGQLSQLKAALLRGWHPHPLAPAQG
jgi:alpha/beta superfamily hydrolase